MFKWIDRSPQLSKLIENLSAGLARQRGLPIVLGVVLIAISFIVHLVNLGQPSEVLDLLWSITHHIGLLLSLIGFLLVQPLGQ
jgi:hypothetical protein